MQVKDMMNEVYSLSEDIALSKIAQIMSSKKIGEIVFVSGGKIKGIITEDDIVRNFDKDKKIKEVMTADVKVIEDEESMDKALDMMNDYGVKRLPVVNTDGKLIGIVRLIDVARHAKELEEDYFFD